MGVFWGLRRLADDSGRFMVLDLREAEGDLLIDLIEGLAPFATGVVLLPEAVPVWRRYGSPRIGRIDAVTDMAALTEAKQRGADAVLADASLGAAATALQLARFGRDAAADVGLMAGALLDLLVVEAPLDALPPGVVGHWATGAFFAPVRMGDRAARRRHIADDLVVALQRLNVAALDGPKPTWIETAREDPRS
ncbi:MAG: hypothetical protein EA356_03070 [Geminicoccaceae bacterium]|nr:MAG: hypothetical protein EA356_03070 [Geminicoccaceae bacterium]